MGQLVNNALNMCCDGFVNIQRNKDKNGKKITTKFAFWLLQYKNIIYKSIKVLNQVWNACLEYHA